MQHAKMPSFVIRLLSVVFFLFALVGSLLGYFLGASSLLDARSIESWVETPCVVLESRVVFHEDGARVEVSFSYKYEGKPFISDRYELVRFRSDVGSKQKKIVDRLPPGKQTVCYVDPADPTRAVLDRTVSSALYWLMIPVGLAIIGVTGLLVLVVRSFRAHR